MFFFSMLINVQIVEKLLLALETIAKTPPGSLLTLLLPGVFLHLIYSVVLPVVLFCLIYSVTSPKIDSDL